MHHNTANLPLPALVLPDVHQKFEQAEDIIAKYGTECQSIVFLGDYVDSYELTESLDLHLAIRWLANSVKDPRRVHLLGNHDVAYFYPGPDTFCSGWSPERQQIFDESFGPSGPSKVLEKLHLAASAGPWLLSHAGFTGRQLRDVGMNVLLGWAENARTALESNTPNPLTACGRVRGGKAHHGGLFWLDWDYEFAPLPGIHQLVGHTKAAVVRGRHLSPRGHFIAGPLAKPSVKRASYSPPDELASVNWCLDANLDAWAIVHPDRVDLHERTGVTSLPSPTVLPPVHPELSGLGLDFTTDANPPAFVEWDKIKQAISNPDEFGKFQTLIRISEHRAEGPTPAETARGIRSICRNR